MLYKVLKRMIERSMTTGMSGKLDIFYATGKITETEYAELVALLPTEIEGE